MSAESLIRTKGILVNVERSTTTKDNAGFPKTDWNTHLSNVRIFLQPVSGTEGVRYGRENNRDFIMGYSPVKNDIQPIDRLTGGALGSRKLKVQSVLNPGMFQTGRMAHLTIELEEDSGD